MNKIKVPDSLVVPKAEFVMSSPTYLLLPKPSGPEFCVAGRSNVGKSSFMNHLFSQHNLARVSKKPGKTIAANYYRLDTGMVWVDLPGYGYAKTSEAEQKRLTHLVSDYLSLRKNLRGVVWLCDIRHPNLEADEMAYATYRELNVPVFILLTKGDKLPSGQRMAMYKKFESAFLLDCAPYIYSVNWECARKEFWTVFSRWAEARKDRSA
jgi:GTP-binding protein